MGNNGIFNRAKTAKELYQNAEAKEETEIAKATNQIDSYVGGNRDYTPISYTTGEQDTGLKWIDGKKIYQQTIQPNLSIGTNATQLDLSTYISNIDMLFIDTTHSWCAQTNGDLIPLTFSPASNFSEWGITYKTVGKNKLMFYVGTKATDGGYSVKYLTLQYTKTNPSAN